MTSPTTPRTSRTQRHVVVTGASSGIGAALAECYAGTGIRLGLLGRNDARLSQIATACQHRGADVDVGVLDVTDRPALRSWLQAADNRQPVDLLIANAGITGGIDPDGRDQCDDEARRLFEVNYFSMIDTVDSILQRMRQRKTGQLALMSSLAGLRGVSGTPTYCATKAAIVMWGESMRGTLAADGVSLSVICPGYVDTPMSRRIIGPKPLPITAEQAARRIRRGLDRRKPVIAFPWSLYMAVRLAPLLPAAVVDALAGRFDVRVAPPVSES